MGSFMDRKALGCLNCEVNRGGADVEVSGVGREVMIPKVTVSRIA